MTQRLLVMSCGKRKRLATAPLPALERYDGPAFRVLRRYLATHPASPPDIYILSARFGLIPGDRPIPFYDQRMTPERAAELQPSVRDTLVRILSRREYDRIYLAVGRDYAQALDDYTALESKATSATIAHGSQGKRLAQLHDWLYGSMEPVAPEAPRAETRRAGQHLSDLRFKGVKISLTADQALAQARRLLAMGIPGSDRFYSWYVELDGKRVAPKWLVSQIVSLPVGAFTTHDAKRVLAELGITVHRNSLL